MYLRGIYWYVQGRGSGVAGFLAGIFFTKTLHALGD
jgi:hypothetical protein